MYRARRIRRLRVSPSPHLPISPSTRRRRGISLLEVLISIFVLLFGLLAVAALIPVAGLRISQTMQADNAAACGQAGLRDVKVRRMTDTANWRDHEGNAVPFDGNSGLNRKASFAIDPLYIANNWGDTGNIGEFPYDTDATAPMLRITLYPVGVAGSAKARQIGYFDRIFTWRDDLAIPVPDDDAERPRQIMIDDAGNGAPFPPHTWETPAPGTALIPQVEGNYSWMVTVVPKPEYATNGYLVPTNERYGGLCTVSVVVFHKREFEPPGSPRDEDRPGERVVSAELLGGGYGGGDVRLTALGSDPPTYLDVEEGQWLLLMDGDPDTSTIHDQYLYQWYRIVAAGDDPFRDPAGTGPWVRDVTLAGPDWTSDHLTGIEAALFNGVIGVYTMTMELNELGSIWTD